MKQKKQPCPAQFHRILEDFIAYLRSKELKESTIKQQSDVIASALFKLDSYGLTQIGQLTPAMIYRIYENTSDKNNFVYPMRSFLNFLYLTGNTIKNYSAIVPARKKSYPNPSVYSYSEIEAFLASFDLSVPIDIRDYAIALLALRIGMRTSDIASLKLDNIDFHKKKISFVQSKTGNPQCLELVPELENALREYITKVRPITDTQNVFISFAKSHFPIDKRSIYYRIKKHFLESGIQNGNRKCGAHALRMTLASELIYEQIPYDVVRKILGHEDAKTMKHYIQFDVEKLRRCAIEVPTLTGKISRFFAGDMEELPL